MNFPVGLFLNDMSQFPKLRNICLPLLLCGNVLAAIPATAATTAATPNVIPNVIFEKAGSALRAGNYAEAYCMIMPLARAGNVEAQYNVGWMYHNGYGLAIDDKESAAWWGKAAAQGHGGSQLALGLLYNSGGIGIRKDREQALRLLLQATEAGEDDARPALGRLLASEQKLAAKVIPDLYTDRWKTLGTIIEVKANQVNVRTGPGKNYKVITTLKKGTNLVQLGQQGNWIMALSAEKQRVVWIFSTLVRTAK